MGLAVEISVNIVSESVARGSSQGPDTSSRAVYYNKMTKTHQIHPHCGKLGGSHCLRFAALVTTEWKTYLIALLKQSQWRSSLILAQHFNMFHIGLRSQSLDLRLTFDHLIDHSAQSMVWARALTEQAGKYSNALKISGIKCPCKSCMMKKTSENL